MQNIQNKAIAEQAALERMLNVYFREHQLYHNAPEHQQWHIHLNDNETLIGTFLYWSMMGHHVYQKQVFIKEGDVISPVTCQHAIERLLSIFEDESNHARVQEIYADIQNSMRRTAHYLNDKDDTRTVDHYIQSEQSLYLGHPFHPTPKSSKGFTSEDLKRYAPECHTHFQLHYLSVDASLILARDVEGL
ncbi:siderophore biosynthesis protein SbnE, partial [Staphylococcus hyicus]|uniref:IucA/IucC family protein n=1 Tax=Staphylococcus hyicus TaxID=1284 RepID=UPI0019E18E33|nr:siderophore biosynthesis protein SbnE [Staphylococcus hyicus]